MPKTKPEQSHDTKYVILLAAYDVVREEGVDQLSSSKIAQYAGISKGGFFHHFRQVDDLYLYMLDELMLSLRQSLPVGDHPTLSSLVDYLAVSLLAMRQSHPEMISMLLHFFSISQQNPEYLRRLQQASTQMFSDWVSALAAYSGMPETIEEREEVVRLIDAFFLGFAIHSLLFDDVQRYRRLAHNFGEMLETTYSRR